MHRTEVERIIESQDWTLTGDWTFSGTVTFTGSSAETFESIIIDGTAAEALLVRKNGDGGDVFTVDSSGDSATIAGDMWVKGDEKELQLGALATDFTVQWDGSDAVFTIAAGDFHFTGGNVGIGTASPDGLLEIESGSSDDAELFISAGTTNDAQITFRQQGTNRFLTGYDDSPAGFRFYDYSGSAGVRLFIAEGGNVGLNTTTFDGTAGNVLAIANGTAPAAGTADQCYLYAKDVTAKSELHCMDEDANETLLSPHDRETGEWIFHSVNKKTGRRIRVNMEKMVKKIGELLGEEFLIEDFIEPAGA